MEKKKEKPAMETKSILDIIQVNKLLLNKQTRRIELLEQKILELRKKYFQLKYAEVACHVRLPFRK